MTTEEKELIIDILLCSFAIIGGVLFIGNYTHNCYKPATYQFSKEVQVCTGGGGMYCHKYETETEYSDNSERSIVWFNNKCPIGYEKTN